MLTRWLTVTALLAASANPQRAATGQRAVTVAPTYRVKGHPEEELTLNCGDGKSAGVVQYWHTPFGDLQTPGPHSKLDPVSMRHDGSLVVPNSSVLHSGLYYCLLQHTEGTTLWSYELHIGFSNHEGPKHGEDEQSRSCDSVRFRRDVGPERAAGVSDGHFAGAVAASVLLTFVLGFSAGALTRAHVLRCLGGITTRVRSPLRRLRKSDTPDHGSGVTVTTLPPACDDEAFEMGQVQDNITISSTASSPPAKPQRSFRHKQEESQETTAYLKGCDYVKEEEGRLEEVEDGGRGLEGKSEDLKGEVEVEEVDEEREFSGFYLVGEGGGGQTEADVDKHSEDGEGKDGREGREEREREQSGSGEGGEEGSEDEAGGSEEQVRDGREEEGGEEETEGDEEDMEEGDSSQQSSSETEEEESGAEKQEDKNDMNRGGGGAGIRPPRPARRSRVIRLYQYDEDGQRYCHLPDPAPEDPVPPPRLKQRSLSLTRLSAIMAAASAGPLDKGEDREERPHFHMEI